jgi:hypothetical protein
MEVERVIPEGVIFRVTILHEILSDARRSKKRIGSKGNG